MLGNFGVIVDELKTLGARIKAKPDAMFGTVSSVSSGTAQVVIDGDTAATPCRAECACTAGDRVTVLRKGISCVAVARDGGDAPATVTTETTVSDIITAGTGVTISAARVAVWGKTAMLQLNLSRSTATAASGTFTVGTVKTAYQPAYAAGGSGNALNGWLGTDGALSVRNVQGSQIAANTTVYISFTYLLP